MTRDQVQIGWRRRREAIGRKGALDADLMIELEPFDEDIAPNKGAVSSVEQSPNSIAALFQLDDGQPKIVPLVLPGAWAIVGKKGKPVAWAIEQQDMYLEQAKSTKKKKKKRARLTNPDDFSLLADLEEGPSSSTCMQHLNRSIAQQRKACANGLEAKYWVKYRKQKEIKIHARDTHIADLAAHGSPWLPWESMGIETIRSPEPLKVRNPKHKISKSEKARRTARKAGMAARCFSPSSEEQLQFDALVQVSRRVVDQKEIASAQVRKVLALACEKEVHASTPLAHSKPKNKKCLIM